jgi:mannose-6-phosphate isomerase-like protein (cupin superfamily)
MTACTLLGPGQGDKYWIVGDHPTFKLSSSETGGAYCLAENWVDAGGGPPPHLHGKEDELFYVLQGKLQFVRGDNFFTATPGDAVFLPRGIYIAGRFVHSRAQGHDARIP